ncbi:prepilin-type N-terminal cleavage/methylation domain-containing protein [Thermomonas sp. S9]|uniref:PilW family protein n=1 Tax=Thermomonas sp. S9 TaxID=2885203 RepID=UPI00216B1EC1|nr:prepilin-type N-terminal cleavage/methylation domain-containing protein [Thermomonas sp. S9]MCR6495835.1 prepilin-type N-terminal cleavage/methylation domain-containing protein [Thermomonas sp. S9]
MRKTQSGFGLIELMIAMVLGLLVMGAAFAVFQSNQRSFQANEGLNRIQESARVAYELISRDLRAAGGTACSNLARPDAEHTLNAEETQLLTSPVGDNGAPAGTELVAASGDDTAYRITAATTSSITLDSSQIADANDAFKTGDRLILCNANQFYVVTATGVTTNTVSFTPATPIAMNVDPMAPPSTVMIARFRNVRWYRSGNGLYVSRNGAAGQQVADGVTALSFTYRQNGSNTYTATPTSWPDVVAVRVNMTLTGTNQVDNKTVTRNVSNVISLRSRAL